MAKANALFLWTVRCPAAAAEGGIPQTITVHHSVCGDKKGCHHTVDAYEAWVRDERWEGTKSGTLHMAEERGGKEKGS
jgi:hypothetical protein